MSGDWDFYPLLVDNQPAYISVDLGLAATAPSSDQPHMAYVRVKMRQPRPDGLSSTEEFEALSAIEDGLLDSVTRDRRTTYVGRITSGGNRDFYFYTAEPAAFAESAREAMVRQPNEFDLGHRPDPEWEVYFDFLYPSAEDLQRILNRRVVDTLEAHGDTLSERRTIDHLANLPSAGAAESLRRFLHERGFVIDEPKVEDGFIVLSFTRTDSPLGIDDVVIPIARRVQELGGEYEGWGCEVVK